MSLSELFGVSGPLGADPVGASCNRLADCAVKGGSGNSEADGDFANGDAGRFKQRANGLDRLWGPKVADMICGKLNYCDHPERDSSAAAPCV